ncbi:natural cytotoxicity triggering receptor 3 ligand 1-like isoform X2 [Lithobates pipiens]
MRIGLKILHIIFFLLLLGSGDFQVRGLTVTGKDGPTEALRGENVTIPCLLSGVLIPLNLQMVSVVWSHRLQNGTENKVHQVHDSHHQSWRNGSHMNDSDLQQGNASLYIPNIQIKDEGDYRCFVIVTPDAGNATSTLHVSVTPQTRLTHDKHIEAGIPRSVICEINNFYLEAVKVRWVKYNITTATNSYLDRDVSFTTPLRNSDGTYNVTSLLTLHRRLH